MSMVNNRGNGLEPEPEPLPVELEPDRLLEPEPERLPELGPEPEPEPVLVPITDQTGAASSHRSAGCAQANPAHPAGPARLRTADGTPHQPVAARHCTHALEHCTACGVDYRMLNRANQKRAARVAVAMQSAAAAANVAAAVGRSAPPREGSPVPEAAARLAGQKVAAVMLQAVIRDRAIRRAGPEMDQLRLQATVEPQDAATAAIDAGRARVQSKAVSRGQNKLVGQMAALYIQSLVRGRLGRARAAAVRAAAAAVETANPAAAALVGQGAVGSFRHNYGRSTTYMQSRVRKILARRDVRKLRLARGMPLPEVSPGTLTIYTELTEPTLGKDKRWADLNGEESSAAATLGWANVSWDNGEETHVTHKRWVDLSPHESEVAQRLGHDERGWDAERQAYMQEKDCGVASRVQHHTMQWTMCKRPRRFQPNDLATCPHCAKTMVAPSAADILVCAKCTGQINAAQQPQLEELYPPPPPGLTIMSGADNPPVAMVLCAATMVQAYARGVIHNKRVWEGQPGEGFGGQTDPLSESVAAGPAGELAAATTRTNVEGATRARHGHNKVQGREVRVAAVLCVQTLVRSPMQALRRRAALALAKQPDPEPELEEVRTKEALVEALVGEMARGGRRQARLTSALARAAAERGGGAASSVARAAEGGDAGGLAARAGALQSGEAVGAALFLASCNGHAEAVAALLAAGADASPPPDADGLTPLYAAAFNGHATVVQHLLAAGAARGPKGSTGGCPAPLYAAAANGREEAVRLLLERRYELGPQGVGVELDPTGKITAVTPGSVAEAAAFQQGAHITSVNGQPVTSRREALRAVAGVWAREEAALKIQAHARRRWRVAWRGGGVGGAVALLGHITFGLHLKLIKRRLHRTVAALATAGALDQPYEPHARGGGPAGGATPLAAAAAINHLGVMRLLLKAGSDASAAGGGGATPLHAAARAGRWPGVTLLLAAGADPTARDADGATPLHLACRGGHGKTCRHLLKARGEWDPSCPICMEPGYRDPATTPCGHTFCSRCIARHQATAGGGRCPLCRQPLPAPPAAVASHVLPELAELLLGASGRGHAAVVQSLLAAGALEPRLGFPARPRWVDGVTPLHAAARGGHAAVIDLLLPGETLLVAGSENLEPVDGRPGEISDWHASLRVVGLETSPEPGRRIVDLLDADGATPLLRAVAGGYTSVMRLLLSVGADPNLGDRGGTTPLDAATDCGHLEAARVLEFAGARPPDVEEVQPAAPAATAAERRAKLKRLEEELGRASGGAAAHAEQPEGSGVAPPAPAAPTREPQAAGGGGCCGRSPRGRVRAIQVAQRVGPASATQRRAELRRLQEALARREKTNENMAP
jgi:cytohesin